MDKIVQRNVRFSQINIGERFRTEYNGIDDLALSIKDKGLIQPPVLDQNLNLLAGGRRIKAIELLREEDPDNWDEIPVIIRESKDELDAREVELIENLMRENLAWDEQAKLTAEIHRLYSEKNQDWSGRKTADLLERSVGGISQHLQLAEALEKMPELAKAKTADQAKKTLDSVYEKLALDELRKRTEDPETAKDKTLEKLLKGADEDYRIIDVFEGLASLPDEDKEIFLIEVDPPYGIDFKGKKRPPKTAIKDQVKNYNEIPTGDYVQFLDDLAVELFRVSAKDAKIVFWFGIQRYKEVYSALTEAGWVIDEIPALWTKKNGQTNQPLLKLARTYETFFYGAKKGMKSIVLKQGRSNQFAFDPMFAGDKYHPTQRPLELIKEIIDTFGVTTVPYMNKILVPFLGSGATIVAAKEMGYKTLGFDNNRDYKEKYLYEIRKSYLKKFELE